jgi:sugar diacid utilization regulator
MVRTTIDVVESAIDALIDEPERSLVQEATLRYSREIAFSAAEVYARAAEARGAWDARLEALVVDSILRDEMDPMVASRISALGWSDAAPITVVAGYAPVSDVEGALDVLRRASRNHDLMLLTGMHGDHLVALVGRITSDEDASRAARLLAPHFGPGPVVIGRRAMDFDAVGISIRAATAAVHAADAWPQAPRPVSTDELLPERAIAGDALARAELIESVYCPLAGEEHLLATAEAFLEQSPSLEGTARLLFVHPNTVRYRLGRITDITGFSATDPRGTLTLRLALMLGRTSSVD